MSDEREKSRLRVAKWRSRNPEKAKEVSRKARAKWRDKNPEVVREYQKSYREKNREVLSDKERQRRFGISRQEYAELFNRQEGVCAICKLPETATRLGKIKSLAVDHDHKTGAVRGLLCSDCNTGIGKLKDDPKVLQAAVQYLTSR
jgi:AraC-like DNA-binding protein